MRDHRRPFQRSARRGAGEPTPEPTATHADCDEQDTTRSDPPRAGAGVGCCTHRVPFHRAAAGNPFRVGPRRPPTRTHADPSTHETAAPVHDTGARCVDHPSAVAAPGLARHSTAAANPQPIIDHQVSRSQRAGQRSRGFAPVRFPSVLMPPMVDRTPCLHHEIRRDRHAPDREISAIKVTRADRAGKSSACLAAVDVRPLRIGGKRSHPRGGNKQLIDTQLSCQSRAATLLDSRPGVRPAQAPSVTAVSRHVRRSPAWQSARPLGRGKAGECNRAGRPSPRPGCRRNRDAQRSWRIRPFA
jgi:hypothetical protein